MAAWYGHCQEKGLQDIKLLAPLAVQDRALLGFSNTTQSSIVCFYAGQTAYFTARWEFDAGAKMWDILYTEQAWDNAPVGKPRFENNTESFKQVLTDIQDLARKIDCGHFAKVFGRARNILSGVAVYPDKDGPLPPPSIPRENLPLFGAADVADVFGAMGSWNDSPPGMAHTKGLEAEYNELSGKLLRQIRLGMLYAVNEW